MTPVMQTILDPDADGVNRGNCLQAAIASLLELPLDEVPHAVLGTDEAWWPDLQHWSRTTVAMDLVALPPGGWTPCGYHLITGRTRGGRLYHATVGCNGQIVHDPHPAGESLRRVGQASLEDEGRLFWMFIPIDPALFVRRVA